MIIEPQGKKLKGRWLGFSTKFEVKDGTWEFVQLERKVTKELIKKYQSVETDPLIKD